MNICCAIIALLLVAPAALAGSRATIRGCGSILVDTLRMACGRKGMINAQMLLLFKKYNRRARKTRSLSDREVDEISAVFLPNLNFIDELRRLKPQALSFQVLIKIGSKINHQRNNRRRFSRSIVKECCHKECDYEKITRAYCAASR